MASSAESAESDIQKVGGGGGGEEERFLVSFLGGREISPGSYTLDMGSLSFRCCGCWRYKIVCSQETLAKVCRGVDKCPPEKPLMYINFLEREGKNRLNYFGKCLAAKVGEGGFFVLA